MPTMLMVETEKLDALDKQMDGLLAVLVEAATLASELAHQLRQDSDSGDFGRAIEESASKAERLHRLLGNPEDAR